MKQQAFKRLNRILDFWCTQMGIILNTNDTKKAQRPQGNSENGFVKFLEGD